MKRHPHRWQRFAFVLAVASVATTMVDAAGNRQSKPFNTWTDMELKGVVTRSPWAGKASITYAQTPVTLEGSAGSRDGVVSPRSSAALVVWSSALPQRQASERVKFEAGPAVSPDVEKRLATVPDAYVITVIITSSSQRDFAPQVALMQNVTVVSGPSGLLGQTVVMVPETSLRRAGKPPIRPSHIDSMIVRDNSSVATPRRALVFVFTFPKTDLLSLADAKVEFATRTCSSYSATTIAEFGESPRTPRCNVNVKKTFTPKDMIYKGVLAL